jgi:membrane-bound lytic murein transglycosylase F
MIPKLLLFCWACCLFLSPFLRAQSVRQDLAFKHWGEVFFPFENWRWWKAQGLAESGLKQSARSACGAIGIMQLMPATAKELGVNPLDEESNIRGGIQYDRRMWDLWAMLETAERRRFMFGAYNSGPGNIRRAWKLAGGRHWEATAAKLPSVTGRHAKETTDYVQRIHRYFEQSQ